MSKSILIAALSATLLVNSGCATMAVGVASSNRGEVPKESLKGGGMGYLYINHDPELTAVGGEYATASSGE